MNLHEERILNVKREIRQESNCIGTALYVLGKYEEDSPRMLPKYENLLKEFSMKEISEPKIHSLAAFVKNDSTNLFTKDIEHMGVVTNLNPLEIFHRRGIGGRLYQSNLDCEILNRWIQNYDLFYFE